MRNLVAPRIEVVEAFRGAASISVALFHFSGQLSTALPNLIQSIGWVGVDVFFIISGFVIPYSIAERRYSVAQFPRFIARRLVRLEPPYLLSIALGITLWHLSAQAFDYRGVEPSYDLAQIGYHLFYLIPFTSYAWLNPVYWSLAYEFVFYLIVGLMFPFLIDRNAGWTVAVTAVILAISVTFGSGIDVRVLEFLLGFLTMRIIFKGVGVKCEFGWLGITLAVVFVMGGLTIGLASLVTIWAILSLRKHKMGSWATAVGSLSYSLYLTHTTIGGRVINLGKRFGEGALYELVLIAIAMAVSVVFAMIFAALVEKPAIAASRKIAL